MKSPKEFFEALSERAQSFMPDPSQIYEIHHNIRRMTNQFDQAGPSMKEVRDFNVPNGDFPVPVRLYVPHQASEDPGPTFIYLHGGGFVTCSIESHEGLCLRIASGSGFRVLSVDYRLAPQFPFPAAPDDCEAVLNWALEGYGQDDHGIDRSKLTLGGDSAGGNMTAYLAQKYRKNLHAQILFYPLMQLVNFKPPKPGPQDWLEADRHSTRLSPLFEKDLKDVPPAYVLTCGLDPLRDEGKLYADNLMAHGVTVAYAHEKAMPHGFLNFSRAFPKARKIPIDAADFLREHVKAVSG